MAILRGFPPSSQVTSYGLFGNPKQTYGEIEIKEVRKFEPTLDIQPGEDRDPHDKERIVTAPEVKHA